MENIKLLCSVLRLYESNFRLLHWNAIGKDFNDSHNSITAKYYEDLGDTIDKVTEIGCMLSVMPLNYAETLEELNNSNRNFLIVDSKKLYSRKQIIELSDIMLADICKLLVECLQDQTVQLPENIGIKADLESILAQYTLEYRFINKRRMMCVEE